MGLRLETICAVFAIGCAAAPEAPVAPEAVVALADAYENPTAMLTPATARAVVDRTQPLRGVLEAVRGLQFIRDIVENATSIDDGDIESLQVRGALDARAACPGWDDAPPDQSLDGTIEVTIGVEESRVQRAFGGRATNCRFVTEVAGQRSNAVASMELEVDLGGSLGLGEPAPPILVRGTNVSGSVNGVALSLGSQALSFRLLEGGAIETLVDIATLGSGMTGNVLVVLHADGRVSLRARDGDWMCGQGSTPCTRVAV